MILIGACIINIISIIIIPIIDIISIVILLFRKDMKQSHKVWVILAIIVISAILEYKINTMFNL